MFGFLKRLMVTATWGPSWTKGLLLLVPTLLLTGAAPPKTFPRPVWTQEGHNEHVDCVAVSPDGKFVA